MYAGSFFKYIYALVGYVNRFFSVVSLRNFDLVIVEKELFPYLPSIFERLLVSKNIKYILDYDDAIFHNYDKRKSKIFNFFLFGKLEELISNATCVHVGNQYLYEGVKRLGANKILLVPTVIDLDKYTREKESLRSEENNFVIGWIGTPKTTKYLNVLIPVLERLSLKHKITLKLIGAGPVISNKLNVIRLAWSEATEVDLLSDISVGVMPLPNEKWENGKCGYKLIQYMALGKPVVASPVGVNRLIVEPNCGFLCSNEDEWFFAFEKLINDKGLQEYMGDAAKYEVEKKYNTKIVVDSIYNSFVDALNR